MIQGVEGRRQLQTTSATPGSGGDREYPASEGEELVTTLSTRVGTHTHTHTVNSLLHNTVCVCTHTLCIYAQGRAVSHTQNLHTYK